MQIGFVRRLDELGRIVIPKEIRNKLDELTKKYETRKFIKSDPIQFPHKFKTKEDIEIAAFIEKYIIDIIFATREPQEYGLGHLAPMIAYGGSPRASISLAKASKAYAFIKRRGYVIPEDVRAVCHDVLRHRIGLSYEAEVSNMTSDEIVSLILNRVEVP